MEPKSTVEVGQSGADAESAAQSLIDALDDHDDVDAVHANFDIPEAHELSSTEAVQALRRRRTWAHPDGGGAGEGIRGSAQNQSPCKS